MPRPSSGQDVRDPLPHPALGHGCDWSPAPGFRCALPAGRRDRRRRGDRLGRARAPVGDPIRSDRCPQAVSGGRRGRCRDLGERALVARSGEALVAEGRLRRRDRGGQRLDPSRTGCSACPCRRGLRRLRGGCCGATGRHAAHADVASARSPRGAVAAPRDRRRPDGSRQQRGVLVRGGAAPAGSTARPSQPAVRAARLSASARPRRRGRARRGGGRRAPRSRLRRGLDREGRRVAWSA